MEYEEVENVRMFEEIDSVKAVYAVRETLRRIDQGLIEHGERVAHIASKICDEGNLVFDRKLLFLLCVFHDIGAYETEEEGRLFEFEITQEQVQRHSVYGYLFLKHMTPLRMFAEAILYHHYSWKELEKKNSPYADYAAMIHLADRIDVAILHANDMDTVARLMAKSKTLYKKEQYDAAVTCMKDESLFYEIKEGTYIDENLKMSTTFIHSAKAAFEYLNMIVYSIDFRSDHTVTHTVNTVSIAVNIAKHFGLMTEEVEHIYLGALLHDIGKISIPHAILESTGRLSDDEMSIMRTHVAETAVLIEGVVPDDIFQLSIRHHEKLDGSGYPCGLKADDLTFSQRIVAVADIISALSSRRSYKEPFPKEKTLSIISDMMKTQLDPEICGYILENYDEIMDETEESRCRVIERYQHIRSEYEKMMNGGKESNE